MRHARFALCMCVLASLAGPRPVSAGEPAEPATIEAIERLRAAGDVEAAADEAGRFVEAHPTDLVGHVAYQDLLLALGRERDLELDYRGRLRGGEATADDHYLYARLLSGSKAVSQYRAALRKDPRHFWARMGLGVELCALGDHRDARRELQAAAEIDPGSGVPWNALGRVAEAAGDREEAEALYRKATEKAPELVVARVNLGVLLVGTGRLEEALEVLGEAVKRSPRSVTALIGLGVAELRGGRPQDAARTFAKALAVDDRSVASLNLVANAHLSLGKLDLAEEALRRALLLAPDNVSVLLNLTHLRLAQADPLAARQTAERAVELDRDRAAAHYLLGLTWQRSGEPKRAEQCYRRAMRIDPEDPVHVRAMAQLDAAQDRWRDAVRGFRKVAEMTNYAPSALFELAMAQVGADDPKDAVSTLEQVVLADPSHLKAWVKLGILCHERVRDRERAIEAYREYLNRGGPDSRVKKWLAELETER